MTPLFQNSNFCGDFITFLEVSKLLITNYYLNFTDKVQITKKCLQFNVFVMTSPFWHYRGVTLDRLLILDILPIKTVYI